MAAGRMSVPVRACERANTRKLCHNCDTKPALAAKTDFIDDLLLLILRNLLKTKRYPKIPAYMARPPFFSNLRTVLAKLCHNSGTEVRFIFAQSSCL